MIHGHVNFTDTKQKIGSDQGYLQKFTKHNFFFFLTFENGGVPSADWPTQAHDCLKECIDVTNLTFYFPT